MKSWVGLVVGLLAAAAASVGVTSADPRAGGWIDFFLIVVVYAAITRSRFVAILSGAAAGLVQDVLTSQVLGFHAFVKTAVTYLIGGMGAKFMLNHPVPQVLSLLLATLLDAGLAALLSLTSGLPPSFDPGSVLRQAVFNSAVGLAAYRLVQRRSQEAIRGTR